MRAPIRGAKPMRADGGMGAAQPLGAERTVRTAGSKSIHGAGLVRDGEGAYGTRGLGHPVLDRLVDAARRLRRCEAVLVRAEAATLAYLAAARRYRDLGVSSLAALAREHLQMAPRTLKNRLSLARMCAASPALEMAFLEGELSGCQILALRPLFAGAGGKGRTGVEPQQGSVAQQGSAAEAGSEPGKSTEPQQGSAAQKGGQPGIDAEIEGWIARATDLPVRELRAHVREATGEEDEDAPEERTFELFAPIEFRVIFDQMCDLARRVMGYDAPPAKCIETILEETGYRGRGTQAPQPSKAEESGGVPAGGGGGTGLAARAGLPPRPARVRTARPRIPPSARVLASAEETLREIEAALATMRPLVEAQAPLDAEDALVRLVALQRRHRPLRCLLSQIVACLQAAGVDPDAAESALGFCPRTLRNLAKQGHLLSDAPLLGKAYRLRVLSSASMQIVHRMAPGGESQKDWLARARGVTARQFAREARFFELLRLADRTLAARFPGPFPASGLEEALRERLWGSGYDDAALNARLAERGISAVESREAGGPEILAAATCGAAIDPAIGPATDANTTCAAIALGPATDANTTCAAIALDPATDPDTARAATAIDPATDPNTMRRLEALLEILVLTEWDDPPKPGDGLSPSVRKTFAPVREMRVRWILPVDVVADLRIAIKDEKDRWPALLPTWAALVGVFARAQSVWGQQDPDRRPVWSKILERDEYRCQAPGCTARRMLVIHHLEFQSQGGGHQVWNLFTLCHPCHAYGIHEGRIRARGRAPGGVIWEMGRRPGRPPILLLHGEKILARRIG